MVDQRLQVAADAAEPRRADVERLTGGLWDIRRSHDRVDEVLDRKQLVAVVALAEDVDAPPFPDPVEQDLEDAEPLGPNERLRPNDRRVDGGDAAERFGVDLRLAVPADTDERVVLLDRVLLRDAVDRRRGDEDDAPDVCVARLLQDVLRPGDVDGPDRLPG